MLLASVVYGLLFFESMQNAQTANGRDGIKSLSLGVKVKKKLLMMRLTEVTI